jgi:hypothetical protein
MTSQTNVRHSLRPLNVFSFCGQPIAAPRNQYYPETRDLPPCPECQRARDQIVLALTGSAAKARARIIKQPS